MRLALIVTNLAGGGAEKAMLTLGSLLAGRGSAVDLVLLEGLRMHAVPAGINVRALAGPGGISRGWLGKRLAARNLRRCLRGGEGYDLIVSTLPFADEVAHRASLAHHWCRIANTLGSEIALLARNDTAKAARRKRRYSSLYGARPLIAVSNGVAADLRANLGLRKNRIETIPNPIDVEAIRAQARAPGDGLPKRPYVIHVGRPVAQKRHDLLLDAWALMPEAPELVLLTEPDRRLEALIAERGLGARVSVAGFQANPYPWIAGARLLVLCSDHEGLPNVLLEALACGTPVVSTDCPSGPAEILREFPECLVPCNDVNALVAAITRSLATPPDPGRMDFSPYLPETVAAAWEALPKG